MSLYPSKKSEKLQAKVKADEKPVVFTSKKGAYNATQQTCPLQKEENTNSEECQYTELTAEKKGRDFKYDWKKGAGIVADVNKDFIAVYEVIAGDEKPETVVLTKLGLAGPCTTYNHKGFSWDIEGEKGLPDAQTELKIYAPAREKTDFGYYLPMNIEPRKYRIRASTCGALHDFTINCYPDTELKLEGSFTFLERKPNTIDGFNKNRAYENKKSGKLTLELTRNGEQKGRVNLIDFENGEKEMYEKFNLIKTFRKIWDAFLYTWEKITGELDRSSQKPFSYEFTFLKLGADLTAKWIEVPNSRYCDFEVSGSINVSPLIAIKFEWDFINYVTNIPYLGIVIKAVDTFLRALEIGALKLKLAINGSIGLASGAVRIRTRDITDASLEQSLIRLNGEIGIALCAVAEGKVQIDAWRISCGGEARVEAGLKAKIADTETILNDFKGKDEKFEDKFPTLRSKQSELAYRDGEIYVKAKIGFSGLVIYTYTYAEGSCSATIYKKESPGSFFQPLWDAVTFKESKSSKEATLKRGATFKLGEDKEIIQAVVGADPLIWQPEISLFKRN